MVTRIAALLACALAVVALTAFRVEPKGDTAVTIPVTTKHFKCNQVKKRAYIAAKREATWRWQTASLVPKTRSNFKEKQVRGCGYLNWLRQLWNARADAAFRFYVELRDPRAAICHVFGIYCTEALAVTWCESRHDIWAENGQYLGLFQMGDYARGKYGHGKTAIEQAVSAYAYFVDSGRDWSPWSCKP